MRTLSIYAKKFDESSAYWSIDPEVNLMFLRVTQSYFNEVLRARGYVFLRDVYERLGIPISALSLDVGWCYDPKNCTIDNFIDFGIDFCEKGPNFQLDFNVDGIIRHCIKDEG